jgi:hypothetical protein
MRILYIVAGILVKIGFLVYYVSSTHGPINRVSQKCTYFLNDNDIVFMNVSLMVDITEH